MSQRPKLSFPFRSDPSISADSKEPEVIPPSATISTSYNNNNNNNNYNNIVQLSAKKNLWSSPSAEEEEASTAPSAQIIPTRLAPRAPPPCRPPSPPSATAAPSPPSPSSSSSAPAQSPLPDLLPSASNKTQPSKPTRSSIAARNSAASYSSSPDVTPREEESDAAAAFSTPDVARVGPSPLITAWGSSEEGAGVGPRHHHLHPHNTPPTASYNTNFTHEIPSATIIPHEVGRRETYPTMMLASI